MLRKAFSIAAAIVAMAILFGCAPALQRPDAPQAAVQSERAAQVQLAKDIRAKRLARLNRIRVKLMPQARDICSQALGKSGLECVYSLELLDNSELNAKADGEKIYINSGMVRFLESDDEIAIVMGHEMAHNMLDHINKKMGSMLLGAIVDGLIQGATGVSTGGAFQNAGAMAYSQEYEEEADYLGLYLASRAGYDIGVAPTLWRRMGIESPGSIAHNYSGTHPSTPERSVALRNAITEIELKKGQGLALLPNRADQAKDAIGSGDAETAIANFSPTKKGSPTTPALNANPDIASETDFPRVVGQWNYRAEIYAQNQGCLGDKGRKPITTLVKKEGNKEQFQSACVNRDEPMQFSCTNISCF